MTTHLDNQERISVSTDPEGTVSVSLDPKGTGPVSLDPEGTGAVPPDPEGTCSVLPDPSSTSPVSPDLERTGAVSPDHESTGSIPPDPWGARSFSPDGDPYRLQPLRVRRYDPEVKLLTPGRKKARLDVTHGHVKPRLGVHIANSDGCVVTVLPTPCTAVDRHVGSPRRPSGRDGTPRPADDVEAWHQW